MSEKKHLNTTKLEEAHDTYLATIMGDIDPAELDNRVLNTPVELPITVAELARYFNLEEAGVHLKYTTENDHGHRIWPENGSLTLNPDTNTTCEINRKERRKKNMYSEFAR